MARVRGWWGRRVAGGSVLALASGVLFAPSPAAAMSCADEGLAAPYLWSGGEVPTNTLIWCTAQPLWEISSFIMKDAAGAVVSGTLTEISLNMLRQVVFRPDAPLEPSSEYTYTCPGDTSERQFTTGSGPSTTAPAVPDLSRREQRATHSDELGTSYLASFSEAAEWGTLVVFDIGGEAALDPDALSGVVSDGMEAQPFIDLFVGKGPCQSNWPEASLGASTTVALGAFDVTGAFSGWSDPVRVTIPGTLEDLTAGNVSEAPVPVAAEAPLEPAALEPIADSTTPAPSVREAPSGSEAALTSGCGLGSSSRMPRCTAVGAAALAALVALRRRR